LFFLPARYSRWHFFRQSLRDEFLADLIARPASGQLIEDMAYDVLGRSVFAVGVRGNHFGFGVRFLFAKNLLKNSIGFIYERRRILSRKLIALCITCQVSLRESFPTIGLAIFFV
jgi:hypothetical protein